MVSACLQGSIKRVKTMNIKDGNGPSKILIGNPDDDLFVVDDLGDRVIEESNGGTYIVETSVDFTLSGFLDYGPHGGRNSHRPQGMRK